MASVLYDLRMIYWLFVWWKPEAVGSGVEVVKNLELGVILAVRKSCLFSPVRDKRDHPNNCVKLWTGLFVSSDSL